MTDTIGGFMATDKVKVQQIKSQLIQMTNKFCNTHVNEEYAELCQRLIEKMARKRQPPFAAGRIEIWAAAIVYAIGSINFLFDKNTKPYASTDTICDYFAVPKRTVGQKSKMIQEMFKIWHFDPEFATRESAENNPFNKMRMVNGFIVMAD